MKVMIVDDDSLVTMSLKTILEHQADFEVVATINDGNQARIIYEKTSPDVVLMDIRMEPLNGIQTGKLILDFDKQAKILYLTTFKDDEYIVEALQMGAKGYLLKQNFEGVAAALRAVYNNQSVYYDEIMMKIPNLLQQAKPDVLRLNITQQEHEVMRLIAQGFNNKEIAELMFLSQGTVRNYISSILTKLNLRDRTQVAIFYYQNMI